MADFYVDENGRITTKKLKKKVTLPDYIVNTRGDIYPVEEDDEDIAPVKSTVSQQTQERTWFQKGAYDDGYEFGDFSKSFNASVYDVKQNLWEGVLGIGEKVVDAGAYLVGGASKLLGADGFAQKTQDFIARDIINEEKIARFLVGDFGDLTPTLDNHVQENSVFGEKSDSLVQSAGQLGATAALQAAGVPWWLTTGATSFGGEVESAFKQDATYGEAGLSAAITAGAEILTEKISGGIKFGGKALDDALTKELARKISDKTVRTLLKLGVDAVGEGSEEVLSGLMSAIGQKLTYADEKEFNELFSTEDAFESFIGGAVLGGGMTGINAGKNAIEGKGRDVVSGLTATEQQVVDKVYESRVAEKEQGGKITEKEKRKIYDEVLASLERGDIDIDTIEEVLGGETYTNYKKLADAEAKMQTEYDELGKKTAPTLADQTRYNELGERLKYVREKGAKNEMKTRLDEQVSSMVKDSRLSESFAERSRRGQSFEADLTQYKDEKQRAIVQKAAESGILNNTRKTHDFVDMVARISAEKGVDFDFANNEKLKESGFAVEGRIVNGAKTESGIIVNVQSAKALDTVVGHEITHVLEGTELYTELQAAAIEYAKTKGDYQGRYDALAKLYKEGTDIDAELTADIVGEYLFTDSDFINNLSTKHRNVFEKIYDEIKYLLKVATAGSKEARQLEQVKRAFEKAYRESAKNNTAEDGGVKYKLAKDADGKVFVDVTEDIFDANNGESVARTIQRVIAERFNNMIEANGQKFQINKKTNDEFRRSNSANALRKNSPQAYNDKLRVIANADEILTAAKNWIGEEAGHSRTDDIVEFGRGNVAYRVGENGYVADVIVGIRKNGSAILYDLVNIYETEIAEAPVTMASNDNSQRRQDASADENVAQNGGDVKNQFSLSEEVEPTDRLVAVHNKSVRGLQRMLDRGGVPFASIAIKKAGTPHEGFGEVSIVFPRSTIDPENSRWNKLYSNDAWTPTEPRTEYDVGDTYKYKKLFENMLGSDIYNALRGSSYLDSDALERELGSSNGDVFEAVKRLGVVKYGYLQSIGQRPEMTTKQKTLDGFGRYKNDQLLAVFEALDGETIRNATYDSVDVKQRIADVLNRQFEQQLPQDDEVLEKFRSNPLYTADKIRITQIQDAYETWEAAGRTIPTEPDNYALENALRDNRELEESEDYRRWVEGTFDGLIKDSGIPNGRDYYTPSGNRRSFKQLHVPATLENIVQQMRKENETGVGTLGGINLRGAATKTYDTVEEMRADSGKLLGTRIEDDVYDGYMDGFHARLNEMKLKAAKGDSWSSRDTAEQVLLEAVRDAKTKAAMNTKLRKEAQWINYDPALVDDLWQLKQDVQNMPAPYFEAKPRRIITTDEAAAYIVPDDAPASLLAKLDELGVSYKTYKSGDEADRLAKLNSVLDEQPDLRFSLSAEGATPSADTNYGRYHVYGRDIALETAEDIAPVAAPADIAPVQTEAAAYEEPAEESPYAELDRLTEQAEALEQQMYEAMDAGDNEKAMAINADLVDAAMRITELEQQLDADTQERLASIEDADAPAVREAPYSESTDTVPLTKKVVQDIAKDARAVLGFSPKRSAEMRELIEKFSAGEIDSEMLHDEIAKRFDTITEKGRQEDVAEVRNWLRTTRLNVSDDIKSDFPDYASSVFKANRGRILFAKNGADVDQFYAEASSLYPGFFPGDIINPADQLQRIIEVANMDIGTEQVYELDQELLESVTDNIIRGVNEYRQQQRLKMSEQNSRAAFHSLMVDADRYAPAAEEDIAPVRADVAAEPVQESAPKQIKNIKERLAAKLQNLQTELEKNQRLREESSKDYKLEILQAQTEYNALQNKNTAKANTLLRRIERLRRISGNIDADYATRISKLEEQVAKASEEARTGESAEAQGAMRKELHASIVDKARAKYAESGYDMDEVFKNAKDLSTFATVDNTPQRVMEKALGYKEGQILADLTVNQVAENETKGIRWLNSYTDRKNGLLAQISKQYGIKPGSKESAAAQMYAEGFYVAENDDIIEYGDSELAKDFPDAKVQENIKGLARDPRIRQIYDATLAMINESRARNAYPEIQKLDNYFLHFRAMDDTFSRLGIPFNPNDIKAKDLPTDLNGVTADLKPGQPYFASAMHRKGKRTSFDLLGGLEKYLTSAKGQIYHIDDIQTLRALRNYIAESYGQAHGLDGLDAMTEEEAAAQIEQVFDAHLSTFAKFLNEEANVIAGKTALIDRGLEGIIGRRGMTFFDTLNRQVGANMVGFNVSSSLTNFIAPVQAFAKTNKAAFVKGFAQTVANRIGSIAGKTDGFIENNPTMIRRQGADRFYRTPWQKAGDLGYALMGAVDSISTEIIVRSKYNELVKKGMSAEQAVTEADKWASRLMGDRSLGQQPQLYNSKMLGLITKFQLEVRNQLDSQFYDTIQEAKVSAEDIQNKQKRNAKVAAQVASTFVQLAVVQHLFGKAFEAVAGYNPAFDIIEAIVKAFGWDDEEESEDTVLDNLGQGFMSLLEDMPYSSVATGGRIPIASALPVAQFIKGKDQYGNEKSRLETVAETAPYWLLPGGYGQIKKTTQGLGMFDEDLPIAGSYTDSGNLRYPVEDTLANRVQAAVFGQYASANARDYFDNERQSLKKNQIQELVDVDIPIREYWDYREGLNEQETLADKFDYIADLDLPIDKKNILINNVVDRKEAVDLTNYDDYANYEEFDFAVKNPEKYDFLQSVGVSVAEYQSFDDDTKDAYNWAYSNPDKYMVSRAVTDDVAVYRQYTKALNDITADKNAEGKSISGSRKTKVINYLNNLDADYYTKIILFKMEYNADDTYNREIIEYLNGRNDISFEEEVTILKELGFSVSADGTVRW